MHGEGNPCSTSSVNEFVASFLVYRGSVVCIKEHMLQKFVEVGKTTPLLLLLGTVWSVCLYDNLCSVLVEE